MVTHALCQRETEIERVRERDGGGGREGERRAGEGPQCCWPAGPHPQIGMEGAV